MIKYHNVAADISIAELSDEELIITGAQDILDIFGDIGMHDCSRLIIHEKNLHRDFFDLKTRLAGEILQKFSNYGVKLAVVGNFKVYQSKSLQDFIRECNRGNVIFFVDSMETALQRLEK